MAFVWLGFQKSTASRQPIGYATSTGAAKCMAFRSSNNRVNKVGPVSPQRWCSGLIASACSRQARAMSWPAGSRMIALLTLPGSSRPIEHLTGRERAGDAHHVCIYPAPALDFQESVPQQIGKRSHATLAFAPRIEEHAICGVDFGRVSDFHPLGHTGRHRIAEELHPVPMIEEALQTQGFHGAQAGSVPETLEAPVAGHASSPSQPRRF
jgi:hypothetical protein